eukprot:5684338-Prymnesium_polylepis.1
MEPRSKDGPTQRFVLEGSAQASNDSPAGRIAASRVARHQTRMIASNGPGHVPQEMPQHRQGKAGIQT